MSRLSFVVGGSEGIGSAVAQRLASRGDDVVVMSRSEKKLAAASKRLDELRQKPGQTLVSRSIDITDAGETTRTIDGLVAVHGTPDVVVNTAGYARPGWLGEIPPEDVRGMVEVNLLGTINLARAVAPHLQAARGGTIVTTSSRPRRWPDWRECSVTPSTARRSSG
ncbi:SDR family NAD(P)-dependent oxidoreductase [Aeromicrobium sp. UC242_57]|uniref:SDR family NAD(P)-dependent oxidoreductase n=1 Tax=Aeromicrobium sp. UC242_57 TaxID=3374624 RepID=UPI0037A5B387